MHLGVVELNAAMLAGHFLHRVVEARSSVGVGGMHMSVLVGHDVVAQVVSAFYVVLLGEQVSASSLGSFSQCLV